MGRTTSGSVPIFTSERGKRDGMLSDVIYTRLAPGSTGMSVSSSFVLRLLLTSFRNSRQTTALAEAETADSVGGSFCDLVVTLVWNR
jgi:hypothetical protein